MGSSIIYIIKGSSLQNEQNENNIYQAISTNYENIEEYELFGFKGTFKNEGVLYRFYTDDNKLYIREVKSNKVCKIIDGE